MAIRTEALSSLTDQSSVRATPGAGIGRLGKSLPFLLTLAVHGVAIAVLGQLLLRAARGRAAASAGLWQFSLVAAAVTSGLQLWLAPIVIFGYAVILTKSRGGLLTVLGGLLALFVSRFGWKS